MRQNYAHPFSGVIGIDQFARLAAAKLAQATEGNFPPVSISKIGDSTFRVELAVAGFSETDLSIETNEKVLTVSGTKVPVAEEGIEYIHRGIANRSFSRNFPLPDYVEVKGATLLNGILSVELVREVPEPQKHRKFEINVGAPAPAASEAPEAAQAA